MTRIGNATLPLPDTVAEKDLEFPPAETWAKAKPLIDDLLGRVARSLAAEVYDRARRPPKSATSGWRSVYPREECVSRPN